MAGIMLRSVAFNDHDLLPDRFARDGGNISPPLEWGEVPDGASELLLMVEDPDAGREAFLHWLVSGIRPEPGGIAEGAAPEGAREWPNSFGERGWGGPQPPRGDDPHRYFFRLYALDQQLDLPDAPQPADVRRAVKGHEFASGNMVARYAR